MRSVGCCLITIGNMKSDSLLTEKCYLFQVMHVLGFDPHAFAHFRDERKRRRSQVIALTVCLLTKNFFN